MSIPNPFSGPFAGAPGIGGNPLDDERNQKQCCPRCKSDNFNAITNQYGVLRTCLDCKEEWSGGTMAVGRILFDESPLPDGSVAPDMDLPVVQYTGASFRDPDKTFGGDDY